MYLYINALLLLLRILSTIIHITEQKIYFLSKSKQTNKQTHPVQWWRWRFCNSFVNFSLLSPIHRHDTLLCLVPWRSANLHRHRRCRGLALVPEMHIFVRVCVCTLARNNALSVRRQSCTHTASTRLSQSAPPPARPTGSSMIKYKNRLWTSLSAKKWNFYGLVLTSLPLSYAFPFFLSFLLPQPVV